jgi:hypothetical protein
MVRYENKIYNWQHDVGDRINIKYGSEKPTKEEISADLFQLERSFNRYWCEEETCACAHPHWVLHASDFACWECMHNPCS